MGRCIPDPTVCRVVVACHSFVRSVVRLVVRLIGREATHFVPLIGAAAAGTMNYFAILGVGKAAISRVESLYGPPPPSQPIVDVSGTVA